MSGSSNAIARFDAWLGKAAWMAFRIFYNWSGALLVVVTGFFVVTMLRDLSSDTTAITNAAFAIAATLSALSFGASRSITEPPDDQDRLRFAGERFLHAAILLLFASTIKYGVFALHHGSLLNRPSQPIRILGELVGLVTTFLFSMALYSGHRALGVLNRFLWGRFDRRHDDIGM